MNFWGLASRIVDEAVELYLTREEAEATLRRVLADEPGWNDVVYVAPVELGAGQAPYCAN